MSLSASRLEVIYPRGTKGLKMSSAEMYTNALGEEAEEGIGDLRYVSSTDMAEGIQEVSSSAHNLSSNYQKNQKSFLTTLIVHSSIRSPPISS